jgi:hypothetical protein
MDAGLQRVTDLFVEGAEAFLGTGDDGKPVVVWMNKLNSFEVEEANRDASVRRAERMAELGPESPETRGAKVEIDLMSDTELREAIVNDQDAEITSEAYDNLQARKDWRELDDHIRRAPQLLADDGVSPDDPRFATLQEKTTQPDCSASAAAYARSPTGR